MKNKIFETHNAQFVGLAGRPGAGKDTGADHLVAQHDFLHVSTSNLLREEAERRGLDKERGTLIELGINLREEYGTQGALILLAIERWHEQRDRYIGGLVVTAMRAAGEAKEILAQDGKLVFVDARQELRYQRIIARQRDDEAKKTLEEFAAHDNMEFEGSNDDPTRPNLRAIMKLSHHVLTNNAESERPFILRLENKLGLEHRESTN